MCCHERSREGRENRLVGSGLLVGLSLGVVLALVGLVGEGITGSGDAGTRKSQRDDRSKRKSRQRVEQKLTECRGPGWSPWRRPCWPPWKHRWWRL